MSGRLDNLTIVSHWAMLLAFPLLCAAAILYWRRTSYRFLIVLALSALLIESGLLVGAIADWPALTGAWVDYEASPMNPATMRLYSVAPWLAVAGHMTGLLGAIWALLSATARSRGS